MYGRSKKQFFEVGDSKVSSYPSAGMGGSGEILLQRRYQKPTETKWKDSAQCGDHFLVQLTDSWECGYIMSKDYRTHTVLILLMHYDFLAKNFLTVLGTIPVTLLIQNKAQKLIDTVLDKRQ